MPPRDSSIRITKAVIPAAGLGTRMLPLTRTVPKEMLPAGRKPMIQWVVEEAVASGLTDICIVLRRGKEIIRDYFSLVDPGRLAGFPAIEELRHLVRSCSLCYVYQDNPRGLGDAILHARDFVCGEAFVMMIPDQLLCSAVPAAGQLLRRWSEGPSIWSSMVRLPREQAGLFVGARGYERESEVRPGVFRIKGLLTEDEMLPRSGDSDVQIRGIGRTVLPPEIFPYLTMDFVNPKTGEVDLLHTFREYNQRTPHYGIFLDGEPCDLGTFAGYYAYAPKIWELSR